MEGAYNKVLKAKDAVPSDSYTFFMELLMDTVRDEIADCMAKAYNEVTVSEAQKLLGFTEINQLKAYATNREWEVTKNKRGEMLSFAKKGAENKAEIPSMKLIQQQLQYARELERII